MCVDFQIVQQKSIFNKFLRFIASMSSENDHICLKYSEILYGAHFYFKNRVLMVAYFLHFLNSGLKWHESLMMRLWTLIMTHNLWVETHKSVTFG